MKQADQPTELISLSVRVPKVTAEKLKEIADREYRPVAAEIRRLIQERVDNDELREAA
jgi:predicted transcriptional regulator